MDLFAHNDSRGAFKRATEELAVLKDADDAVISLRRLVAEEPLALLYFVDGSYVKVSPTRLKTSNGADDSAASVQMRDMLRKSYKEHLANNRGADVKPNHYGAAEVTSEVGAVLQR